MKKGILWLCVLAALMLVTTSCAWAVDVPVVWDYTQDPAFLATGFEIRLANVAGGAVVRTLDCGMPAVYAFTIPQVVSGAWFAKLYAYGTDVTGKVYADPTNELSFTVASGKPAKALNFRLPK